MKGARQGWSLSELAKWGGADGTTPKATPPLQGTLERRPHERNYRIRTKCVWSRDVRWREEGKFTGAIGGVCEEEVEIEDYFRAGAG